jgi:hypothetical protein
MSDETPGIAVLEDAYDLIADGIDQAGEAKAQLFLAKLCLALAHRIGDRESISQSVQAALRDL